jgi:AcrR family transcriptional regulator
VPNERVPNVQRKGRASARPGRRLDRAFLSEIKHLQRERAIAAAIEVVEAGSYASLTVTKVTERSAISRRTFYELFYDREDCFLAAFEQILAEAHDAIARAYASQPDRHGGARAAVLETIALIDQRPGAARLCIVEALAAGQRVLERRARVLDDLAGAIDRAFTRAERPDDRAMASAVAGAVAAMLHTYVVAKQLSPANLSGTLMALLVLPYQGRAAADAELTAPRPARKPPAKRVARESNPLQKLNLRLTYRTIRVLIAIAERPGASNLQIAQASDIGDQGQISKLLRRLRELKLIENFGDGQPRGRANAWRLTALGEGVQRATGGR